MTDKPILFSGPMVRALLEGRKTQTRRYIDHWCEDEPACVNHGVVTALDDSDRIYRWPRTHAVGDRLWVRETWAPISALTHNDPGAQALADGCFYRADEGTVDGEISAWKPSIFMPRRKSRITLIVTDVRVQRLQEISEDDAIAEGVLRQTHIGKLSCGTIEYETFSVPGSQLYASPVSARDAYADLWNSVNGTGAWEKNPWVAAYSFEVIKANIDEVAK